MLTLALDNPADNYLGPLFSLFAVLVAEYFSQVNTEQQDCAQTGQLGYSFLDGKFWGPLLNLVDSP